MSYELDKMHVFNSSLLEWLQREKPAFWDENGIPQLDYDFLLSLLRTPLSRGDSVRSGTFANALDLWVARELEHSGFEGNSIWPRATEPRTIDPCLANAISANGHLPSRLKNSLLHSGGAATNANVMGSVFQKQVDVGISNWLTGPELLISTKTMSGSFGKNLSNRFEEAYGDVKNLRGRHPLAAHGFLFLARSTILDEPSAYAKAVHMLRQLSRDGEVYDAVAFLIVDWEDPSAEIGQGEIRDTTTICLSERSRTAVPKDLSCERFFSRLIDIVLANSPITAHETVRRMKAKSGS